MINSFRYLVIVFAAAVLLAGCTFVPATSPASSMPPPASPTPAEINPLPTAAAVQVSSPTPAVARPTRVATAVPPRAQAPDTPVVVTSPPSPTAPATREPHTGSPAATAAGHSAQPDTGLVRSISLGVPAGDSYAPVDLAVDPQRQLAYVYHLRSTTGGPVIAVIDLATHQVTRQIGLTGFSPTGSGGRLFLAPDGQRAFVTEQDSATLVMVDLTTGVVMARLDGVRDAALGPDGRKLYVSGQDSVRAYTSDAQPDASGWTAQWQVDLRGAGQLAAHRDRVLVSRAQPSQDLMLLDGATGRTLATYPLPEYSQALALGPDGGWAVRTGGVTPQVLRFDADLRMQASATVSAWGAFFFDEPRQRYVLSGYRSSQPDLAATPVIVTLAASDLVTQTETLWPGALAPDLFHTLGQNQLLGLTRYSGAQLMTFDASGWAPTARAVLGVELTGAALDATRNTLYVADNQARIHVLDWPDGTVRAVWPGAAPIALDAANQRIYVNRAARVVALDSLRGEVLAEFDRDGFPAPDGSRDRVAIANAGVTIYDRAGQRVGQLDKTFPTPQGFSPNPRAVAAYANPVNGYLLVELNNGVPGSNNSDFVQVYAPGETAPVVVPSPYNFVVDVLFDPRDGSAYVSYAGKGSETIQHLQATGSEVGRLQGRTGLLFLDDAKGTLYAYHDGALAALDAASLTVQGVYRAPAALDQLIWDPARRWVLGRAAGGSRLDVLALDELPPLAMRPQPIAALPDRPLSDLQVSVDARGTVLYGRIDNELFRSRDGQRWERMPVGSWPSYGQLTVAAPGILYYTNLAAGGSDGVLRSRDGGDSWEFLDAGLHDLRLAQPVVARGEDLAYAIDRSGHLLAWQAGAARWETMLTSPNPYTPLGTLSLAPDGTLLLLSYERYRHSTDGGQTWAELPTPGQSGSILGFGTDYATSPPVYAYFGIDSPSLARSRDGGLTWEPLTAAPAIGPFAPNFKFAVTGRTLYLFTSDYAGTARLARSLDEGTTWQEADQRSIQGSYQLAVGTDGRLWLGRVGQVQGVDPDALRWTAVAEPS